jgi:hypothetical protein
MRWDDFARVGSPIVAVPAARGLSLGQGAFPPALGIALARAGVRLEATADLTELEGALRNRKPDVVIASSAALGSEPEAAVDRLIGAKATGSCATFLVREERLAPDGGPLATRVSELLGSGQDALGYFLMIRATLRRTRPQVMTDVIAHGGLSLDHERFTLSLDGVTAPLNRLEFCLIGAMLDAPRMVWHKAFLNRVVFGPAQLKPGRHFDTYMSRVRRSIRGRIGTDPVVSERGLGYALSPALLGAPPIARLGGA